jgi:death on curing protein
MSEVLLILQDQIRRYGGSYGVRDPALLSSAMAMPQATYEGKLLHSELIDQAAAYAYHLCQNHPFIDGNKRTALAAALVFLDLNGIEISDPEEKLYELMINVAEGKRTKKEIAEALRKLNGQKRRPQKHK